MNSRSTLRHIPVLDTHITEFTEPRSNTGYVQETESRRYREREDSERGRNRRDRTEDGCYQELESRMFQNMGDSGIERNRSDNHSQNNQNRHSSKKKDKNEPTSWAEFNALRGKNFAHSNLRSDLQGSSEWQMESSKGSQMMPDFNSLLQMGQQMLLPPVFMGMGGFPFPNTMAPMGGLGLVSPSVSGLMGGRERYSPDRDRGRRDHYNSRQDRSSRRDHPYNNDQGRQDHRDDHRRHDRGYSSSRSSHDRERSDRRSR